MDEITLTHAGLACKVKNVIFLPFLAAQKFIANTNIQIHAMGSICIVKTCFLNAPNNVLYHTYSVIGGIGPNNVTPIL